MCAAAYPDHLFGYIGGQLYFHEYLSDVLSTSEYAQLFSAVSRDNSPPCCAIFKNNGSRSTRIHHPATLGSFHSLRALKPTGLANAYVLQTRLRVFVCMLLAVSSPFCSCSVSLHSTAASGLG